MGCFNFALEPGPITVCTSLLIVVSVLTLVRTIFLPLILNGGELRFACILPINLLLGCFNVFGKYSFTLVELLGQAFCFFDSTLRLKTQ